MSGALQPHELAELGRCPLAAGGEARRCGETACRLHVLSGGAQGPVSAARHRLQLATEEACAADLERIGPHRGRPLTAREVGVVMGMSKQGVEKAEKRAIEKVRAALRILGAGESEGRSVRRRR